MEASAINAGHTPTNTNYSHDDDGLTLSNNTLEVYYKNALYKSTVIKQWNAFCRGVVGYLNASQEWKFTTQSNRKIMEQWLIYGEVTGKNIVIWTHTYNALVIIWLNVVESNK